MVCIKLLLRRKTFLKEELSERSSSFILCVHMCVADMISSDRDLRVNNGRTFPGHLDFLLSVLLYPAEYLHRNLQ